MAIWYVVLYSFGTVLAMRSLVSLMAHHKQHFERKLQRKHQKAETSGSVADTKPSAA